MGAKYREAEDLVLNDLSVMELEDLADLISDVLEIKRHRRRLRSEDDCACDDCLDDDEEEDEILNRPALRGKVAPKYRNPLNTSQIWSGRGMKPRWLVEQISQGRTLDDFLINLDEDGRTFISTPKKE